MTLTPATMSNHVRELARLFDVELVWDENLDPGDAGAGLIVQSGRRFVRCRPVTDETSYVVNLHELGHCVAPNGMLTEHMTVQMQNTHVPATLRDVRLQLEEEINAWKWAKHYALDWTPTMTHVRNMTFDSYRRKARQFGVNL